MIGDNEETTVRRFSATSKRPTRARTLPCRGFILGKRLFSRIGVNF
jgi:hypothetical protein